MVVAMDDDSLIKHRNQLMVKGLWLFVCIDIVLNLVLGDFSTVMRLILITIPSLLLITYLVKKNIGTKPTMYIISVLFIAVLFILNESEKHYINLFFLILPPIYCVSYRNWKNIIFTTVGSAIVFSYFILLNGESYFIHWKPTDLYYFLLFFLTYAVLKIYESRFTEGVRVQLNDELNRVKRLQRKLHEGGERYRAMMKQSSEGIYAFDPTEKTIVETNERFCEMLGYEEQELIKLSLTDIIISDESMVDLNIKNVLINNRFFVGEKLYRRKDGTAITVEVSGSLVHFNNKSFILANIRDITEQKEIERELRENEEQLRQIHKNMTDIIVKTDNDYMIQYVSPACKQMIGYDANELINHSIFDFIRGDIESKRLSPLENGTVKKIDGRFVLRQKHRNGHDVWIEASGNKVYDEVGNKIGAVTVCRDITERIEAEALIQKQDRLLNGVAEAMNCLLTDKNHTNAIQEAIEVIGKAIQVDRVYIFENHLIENGKEIAMSQRYEWASQSNLVQINNPILQNVPYMKAGFARWFELLSSNQAINGPVKNFPECKILRSVQQTLQSVLIVPIFILDEFWGFIGFEDCVKERNWNKNEEAIIQAAAAGIGGAIKIHQDAEKIKQTSARLEALISHMPYGILAEDKDNRLILINQQFNEIFRAPTHSEKMLGMKPEEVPQQGRNIFQEEDLYDNRSKEIITNREKVLSEEWKLVDGRIISRDAIPIFTNGKYDGFLWQFKDTTEQKRIEQELKDASFLDGLTTISNRRFFDKTIFTEWGRCSRTSKSLTLIMLDIDYFKDYNDKYGHQRGDECLIKVAQTINETIGRPSDVACRYGGEEFAVILPDTHKEGGIKMAEKIRVAIENLEIPHITSSVSAFVTCSFGVATVIPSTLSRPEEIIRMADKALYTSKTLGRNCVNYYDN